MEKLLAPIELEDADLEIVAGGVLNINIGTVNAVAVGEAEVAINQNNAVAQTVSNFLNG
jgi:hypothetical protein